jgi:hypothetical protein
VSAADYVIVRGELYSGDEWIAMERALGARTDIALAVRMDADAHPQAVYRLLR